MSTARSLLSAVGTSFALTLGGTGDKLAFQPPSGSTLTKTFTTGSDFALDEMSITVNGNDMSDSIPDIDVSLKQENKIEVTDIYKAVAAGHPTELLRTFDALSGTMHMDISPAQMEMPEMSSSSELEGKTVAFHWNEESQAYERSFHESEGDAALLEGLQEDMDLRVFLPKAEVSTDETWTVPLSELGCLLMPGGNLRMLPTDMQVDPESMKIFEELFERYGKEYSDELEGECTCTYKGARDVDGVHVAEIAIDLEVATTLDLSGPLGEVIKKAIDENGAGDKVQVTLSTADLNVDFDGSGVLHWNAAAGRVQSFQIGGDITLGIDFSVSVEVDGGSQAVDASLEMSGSMQQAVETKE